VFVILIAAGIWLLYANRTVVLQPSETKTISYLCEQGKTIEATYATSSVSLKLSDGRSMTLPQTSSASGIRYANADESLIFWSKGNGAFTMENNKEVFRIVSR